MKIYFTPRDIILNRFNDDFLTEDHNEKIKIP